MVRHIFLMRLNKHLNKTIIKTYNIMKTAIIIGSTGLIGSHLLAILTQDRRYEKIYSISRKPPAQMPATAIHIPFDDGNYAIPPACDVAFCCLGTTMKKAGSKAAFVKVDLELVAAFAQKTKNAGVNRLAVVSSIGADAGSSNFYLKTKGQAEAQVKKAGFERLVIVRPSLLLGNRQEKRLGEDIGKFLYSAFSFAFVGPLRKYRGIHAAEVAKAMIALAENGTGTVIAQSDVLPGMSKAYDNHSEQGE
jgi:uncharacterized protein YbjT (DUF2867 family)